MLSIISRYQVERYRGDTQKLDQIAVSFTGSIGNSHDPERVLLINDPFSQQSFFYEFRSADILYAEEQPSLSMPDGSTLTMARLWVKKGATALRIEPFHVHDTAHRLKGFFN